VAEARSVGGALALVDECVQSALDWLYPPHCRHCGSPLAGGGSRLLCGGCEEQLFRSRIGEAACAECGLPLSGDPAPGTLCMDCRAMRREFDVARAFFRYAGPVASLIRAFKFDGEYRLGPALLRALLEEWGLPEALGEADSVVPVPLHPKRRRERGYDQAVLLARTVARRLGRPLLRRALTRTRYTSQQSLLPVSRRWDNVRAAFSVRDADSVSGRRLLLVDDVMTTGSTADQCARVLKRAGAAAVAVLTLARTGP